MLNITSANTLEGNLPASDCENNFKLLWLSTSSTGSFFIGDEDYQRRNVARFILGKHNCKIDSTSFFKYLADVGEIAKKYRHMFYGPVNILRSIETYFRELKDEERFIVISYDEGDRYLKTSKYDANVAKFKAVLMPNITNIKIEKNNDSYIIYVNLVENWRELIMKRSAKCNIDTMKDVFNNFMVELKAKGKSEKDASILFGVKYAPLLKNNYIDPAVLIQKSNYNSSECLSGLRKGIELSPAIIWESNPYDSDNQNESNTIKEAWFVGATGTDENGVWQDFSNTYIKESRWENRYSQKYTEIVKTMKEGDYIVIKSSYTRKKGLPFINNDKVVGTMAIKAIGVIVKNHLDGHNLDVDWEEVEPIKEWFGFGVLRNTVHLVKAESGPVQEALLRFVFEDEQQDYTSLEALFSNKNEDETLDEGVVLDNVLPLRKPRINSNKSLNTILYGAPGTGKTYSTIDYALSIIENREPNNKVLSTEERTALMNKYKAEVAAGHIVFTTFHQSYGYEDFIQGLRPINENGVVKFEPVDGVFKKIADKAMYDNNCEYVVIIDEINRANISKVFGELITLIENDKRWGELNGLSVTLPNGELFAVPNNLHILGTMNSADKSISLIDVALRRRFDFIEVVPDASLIENKILKSVFTKINNALVDALDSTDLLIGHAYFMGKTESDLCDILNRNIIPLLYEYFYDQGKKVENLLKNALSDLQLDVLSAKVGRVKVVERK